MALIMVILLVFAFTGCGVRVEESAKLHTRNALEAAALDLKSMGFDVQSMKLYEEACRLDPDPDRTLDVAGRFAGRAACNLVMRLYPSSPPEALEAFLLENYLKAGDWQAARAFFDEEEDDPRLKKLNDILSHSRRVREPFDKPNALSWRVEGCTARNANGRMRLSSGYDRWLRTDGMGFHTSLGWNGGDFRQEMDLRFLKLDRGTRILWGLSQPVDDSVQPVLLLDYRDGVMTLACNGEARAADTNWYLPMRTWLTFGLEYITPDPDLEAWTGKMRAYVEERSTKRRLLVLELDPPCAFTPGRLLAGFFSPRDWEPGRSALSVSVDRFSFDN
jgi:hypothetical protein